MLMHVYPPFTTQAGVHQAFVLWKVGGGGGRGGSGDKKRGREGGIYIINYDFITWFQFLWDLLFRGRFNE